jgi:hypothetical protein
MSEHLRRLLKSMRRSLQRHSDIDPDRLRHVVDERGDHHIAIVLSGDEIDVSEPCRRRAKTIARATWSRSAAETR